MKMPHDYFSEFNFKKEPCNLHAERILTAWQIVPPG